MNVSEMTSFRVEWDVEPQLMFGGLAMLLQLY